MEEAAIENRVELESLHRRLVKCLFEVRHRDTSEVEVIELIMEEGSSVLLTPATDWTLTVTEGR